MTGGHTYQVNPPEAEGQWFGFKWGTDVMPDGEAHIFELAGTSFAVSVMPDGTVKYYNTLGGSQTLKYTGTAGQIQAQKTYLIELKVASGDHQVWLNNVLLFSDTDVIAGDDLNVNSPVFNDHLNAVTGCTFYFDDIYWNNSTASASNQIGRRGWASVYPALLPAADVGASAPTGFTNSASLTFGNATTGWFSAIDDALPFASAGTDFVGKSTANTNQYEVSFKASQAGITPTAVYLVAMILGASAASCNVSSQVKANSVSGSAQSNTLTTTTPQVHSFVRGLMDVPSAGVAWTKPLLDGVTLLWGSSTDVNPNPKLAAAYLMYEAADPLTYEQDKIGGALQAVKRAAFFMQAWRAGDPAAWRRRPSGLLVPGIA